MKYLLGTGELNWNAEERRSDRYGTIGLFCGDETIRLEYALLVENTYGKLTANVKETRKSYHIGDLARGIKPSTPEVGESFVLGEGTLFIEKKGKAGEDFYIGLKPADNRETDWLNPHILYKVHHQTVVLYFETEDE